MTEAHDLSVQATNNSSIVSKRSVEKLYNDILYPKTGLSSSEPRNYFEYFVPRFKRRSPAINRGYLLRLLIFKQSLQRLFARHANGSEKIYVINLGCGFDPIPFEYLDPATCNNVGFFGPYSDGVQVDKNTLEKFKQRLVFVDIDYHDLINEKVRMIRNSEKLKSIIGANCLSSFKPSKSIYKLVTESYIAVQCDLNNDQSYLQILQDLMLDSTAGPLKIFIAEISITYMAPEKSDLVIKHSMSCENSHFLILEQLIPDNDFSDKFVKKMIRHFHNVNSPIQTVEQRYRTFKDQYARYQRLVGNTMKDSTIIELVTVMRYWNRYISDGLKHAISKVEAFDEYEEFNLFCQHYYFGHITNVGKGNLLDSSAMSTDTLSDEKWISSTKTSSAEMMQISFNVQPDESGLLHRRFNSACYFDESSVLVNSGFSNAKLNSSVLLSKSDTDFVLTLKPDPKHGKPDARMCHKMVRVKPNKYLLIGGRSSPEKIFDDCWFLEKSNNVYQWRKTTSLPQARHRFGTLINHDSLIVCGGLNDKNASPFLKFDLSTETWSSIPIRSSEGTNFEPRTGNAVVSSENGKAYLVGGMTDTVTDKVDNCLYELDFAEKHVQVTQLFSHELLDRYGASLASIGQDKLLLFGGVSSSCNVTQDTTAVVIDLAEKRLVKLHIDDKVWDKFPLPVAGELVASGNKLCYVGGGAVCYSFGSYWNNSLLITIGGLSSSNNEIFKSINPEVLNSIPIIAVEPKSNEKALFNVVISKPKEIQRLNVIENFGKEPFIVTRKLQNDLVSILKDDVSADTKVDLTIYEGKRINKTTMQFNEFITTCFNSESAQENKILKKFTAEFFSTNLNHFFSTPFAAALESQVPIYVSIVSLKLSSALKYDDTPSGNLKLVAQGTVLVRLYPASQINHLRFTKSSESDIPDIFSRNPKLPFNRKADLTPYEAELQAGEALYVPPKWLYATRSTNDGYVLLNSKLK